MASDMARQKLKNIELILIDACEKIQSHRVSSIATSFSPRYFFLQIMWNPTVFPWEPSTEEWASAPSAFSHEQSVLTGTHLNTIVGPHLPKWELVIHKFWQVLGILEGGMEGMKSALLQPPAMWVHTLPEASLPVSMISEFPLLYIHSCYVLICFPELCSSPYHL